MHFDHILVTTDFSEDSKVVFDLAAYQSKMEDTKITVLTVVSDWEVPEYFMKYIPDPAQVNQYRKELIENAERELTRICKATFHGQNVQFKAVLSSRAVGDEICDFAKKNECDLIVIASHGRGGIGTLMLGSVVQKVIKQSSCPVLVMPKATRSK